MQYWVRFSLVLCAIARVCVGSSFSFASYYGEHMVLQKAPESAVIWGYGADGASIELSLSGPEHQPPITVPVIKGVWRVTLKPVLAGGPYNLTAVQKGRDNAKLVLTDMLFGDVWLCGGQSNMVFTLGQVYNASEELAMVTQFSNVRVFQAALVQSKVELKDLAGVEVRWSRPTPEVLGGKDFTHFSAVCWLFGRELYKTLKYPVGLVQSCWGGTPVEAWSSPRALHKCGLKTFDSSMADLLELPSLYYNSESEWTNSVLWNAMIHPLLNMTIKGAIWYQGEANGHHNQAKYSCTFPALIDDWRMAFHASSGNQTALDFPFGFVQLCTSAKKAQSGFPEIRWHQTADYGFVPNERMKKTFMAVAVDLPDETSPWGSIHPRDKQDVAYRLVLGARAVAYEEKGVSFQGPFPSMERINETFISVTYNQKIQASPSSDIFEICCSENKMCDASSIWIPAPMKEQGADYVVVSIESCPVNNVAALRYAWADWPCDFKKCPIYSQDGVLPAPPFTLNRWP